MMTNESALAAAALYAKREELLNEVLGIVRGDGVVSSGLRGSSTADDRDDVLRINASLPSY